MKAITKLPLPRSVNELQRFLGMYYIPSKIYKSEKWPPVGY